MGDETIYLKPIHINQPQNHTKPNQQKSKMQSIRANLKIHSLFKSNTIKAQQKQQEIKSKITLKKKKSSFLQDSETESVDMMNQNKNINNDQQDISIFEQRYQMLEKIGEGANGIVRKCKQIKSGLLYAVKISSIEDQHIVNLRTIFKIVKNFDHPNIIKYKQMYIHTKKHMCYLVMQYVEEPSLRKFKDLSEEQIRIIIKQLLKALIYLHSNNICHRDIKPDNILYNRITKKITIIDFGISHKIMDRGKSKEMWSPTGTIHYKAPQMLSGGGYDQRVDIWAVGIILFQLITGQTPFQSEYLSDQIQKIVNLDYKIQQYTWSNSSKFAKDLVLKLLRDKKTRFTPQQALRTAWFLENNDTTINLTTSAMIFQKQKKFHDEQFEEYEFPMLYLGRNTSTNLSKNSRNYQFRRMLTLDQNDCDIQKIIKQFSKGQQQDIITTN